MYGAKSISFDVEYFGIFVVSSGGSDVIFNGV